MADKIYIIESNNIRVYFIKKTVKKKMGYIYIKY